MRIVHLAKYYKPERGGIESVTVALAEGAAARGLSCTVLCFSKALANGTEVMNSVTVERVRARRVIASQPLSARYMLRALVLAWRSDVVHIHAPNIAAFLVAAILPKRVSTVIHWHSDVVGKGLLGRVIAPLERVVLHRARSVIATSHAYSQSSTTLAPFLPKTHVVPIGIQDPVRTFREASLDATQRQTIDAFVRGRHLVLSVGRLVPYKGFGVLIKAALEVSDDAALVIVGKGKLYDELSADILSLGLRDKVLLQGEASPPLLDYLLRNASIFCLPSTTRAEAFGVVLLEALAYGKPVVASNIAGSGVPWVNLNGVTGVNIEPNNARALSNAINQTLSSDRRQLYGTNARRRYEEQFTLELFVDRIIDIYRHSSSRRA